MMAWAWLRSDIVVQFYPWFKFYFPFFQTHYHTLSYPKSKENKILTTDYDYIKQHHRLFKMNLKRKDIDVDERKTKAPYKH